MSRPATSTLGHLSAGRCLRLDQRICSQHTFPAALISLLITYLSLVYPGLRVFHEATKLEEIVLTVDSSDGNLYLAFSLVLQYLKDKMASKVIFHEDEVEASYPAEVVILRGAHGDAM
ncbi:hypothetical protein ACMFMF_005285 [Clarireedia jacksonii]